LDSAVCFYSTYLSDNSRVGKRSGDADEAVDGDAAERENGGGAAEDVGGGPHGAKTSAELPRATRQLSGCRQWQHHGAKQQVGRRQVGDQQVRRRAMWQAAAWCGQHGNYHQQVA